MFGNHVFSVGCFRILGGFNFEGVKAVGRVGGGLGGDRATLQGTEGWVIARLLFAHEQFVFFVIQDYCARTQCCHSL